MNESTGVDDARQELIFRSAITLQRPVLDPCLAVGFLPLPSDGLRVGQLVKMQWRVERLKDLDDGVSKHNVSSNKQRTILITFQFYDFMVFYFSGAGISNSQQLIYVFLRLVSLINEDTDTTYLCI